MKKTNQNQNLCKITLPLALCALLSLPSPTHAREMQPSDGAANDWFGSSVSVSGTIGISGARFHDVGSNTNQGAAYVFRNLHTATGTITQNVKLVASDGAANDQFGGANAVALSSFQAVAISNTTALVGAWRHDIPTTDWGAAYLFRNLDTATGTITQSAKLAISPPPGFGNPEFGNAVAIDGTIGLVGAYYTSHMQSHSGRVFLYRNLDTATGTITQNAMLQASTVVSHGFLGNAVAISGTIGAVGASTTFVGSNAQQGRVYIFRNLDTVTGTVTENAQIVASDGAAFHRLGSDVSISGTIGLFGALHGSTSQRGAAYVVRNLDTITGTVNEDAKLTASDAG